MDGKGVPQAGGKLHNNAIVDRRRGRDIEPGPGLLVDAQEGDQHDAQAQMTGPTTGTSSDEAVLMQTGGRRLTNSERSARPRRPQEWLELMTRIKRLMPDQGNKVLSLLKVWITSRINRVGHMFVALRDTIHACMDTLVPDSVDCKAIELANAAIQNLEAFLDRNHRSDMLPTQPQLVQEALRQAVRIDELDLSLYPVEESKRTATELEEVHLMFRANNLIRERMWQIRVLLRAVRQQMGLAARHLRRLGICLHGIQMIGCEKHQSHADMEEDADWIAELLDLIHMMAGTETAGICTEGPWGKEILPLRRWLG